MPRVVGFWGRGCLLEIDQVPGGALHLALRSFQVICNGGLVMMLKFFSGMISGFTNFKLSLIMLSIFCQRIGYWRKFVIISKMMIGMFVNWRLCCLGMLC